MTPGIRHTTLPTMTGALARKASIYVAAIDAAVLAGLRVGPLAARIASAIEGCAGRGWDPRAMGAAIAYYSARWAGVDVAASTVYTRLGVPKQSFHNALNRLLAELGHSRAFRRVLRGELGARVCRTGVKVVWEAYGAGSLGELACGRGLLEDWPGPRVPRRALLVWRAGRMKIALRTVWDVPRVIEVLREAFGGDFFTAGDAARILLIDPRSASTLLSSIADAGMLEKTTIMGRVLYRVKEDD